MRTEFDKILLDAPCSGLGVIRRNPDIKWKRREGDMKTFHNKQLSLLEGVKGYLKKGGELLYAVCSIDKEECQDVISFFLRKNPDFRLVEIEEPVTLCRDGYFMTLPHRDNMDGFFGAKLCKI